MSCRKVGILGYGKLAKAFRQSDDFQLIFVWNRSVDKLKNVLEKLRIINIEDTLIKEVDLIVEVAHPAITENYGCKFLEKYDYIIDSPTALAVDTTWQNLQKISKEHKHAVYVPGGAFWGVEDIRKMADLGTLKVWRKICWTLRPNDAALVDHSLTSDIDSNHDQTSNIIPIRITTEEVNASVRDEPLSLYDGPVCQLCSMAPNNVNTMAAACVAGHNLGFDGVHGVLISDPRCIDFHIVEVEVEGENGFSVKTVRKNPAPFGAITGLATYHAMQRIRTVASIYADKNAYAVGDHLLKISAAVEL